MNNERRHAIKEVAEVAKIDNGLKKSWLFYYSDGVEESLVVVDKHRIDVDEIKLIDDRYNNVYNDSF